MAHNGSQRLGSIQARHPQVADLYEMQVTEKSGVLALEWQSLPGRQNWQQAREGAYLLRTNLTTGKPEELWKSYIQITEAEAAFRVLGGPLSIRPIFHQLERRAKQAAEKPVVFLLGASPVAVRRRLGPMPRFFGGVTGSPEALFRAPETPPP